MNRLYFFIFLFFASVLQAQENPQIQTILQKGHAKKITCYDFSPNGKFLLTGSIDNSIILWDMVSDKEIKEFKRHTEEIKNLQFHPKKEWFISSSADNTAKIFNYRTGEMIESFDLEKKELSRAYFSTDGSKIILLDKREIVFVYDVETFELIGEYNKAYGVTKQKNIIDPTGKRIISTSNYQSAHVIDIAKKDTLLSIPFDKVYKMDFSPNGNYIALSSTKLFTEVFDAKTGKKLYTLIGDEKEQCDGCNTSHAFSNNSNFIISISNKAKATIWDLKTGKKIQSFNDLKEKPTSLLFSPDDEHVLIGFNNDVVVLNVKSGKEIMRVTNPKNEYFEFSFSPNGKNIIIAGENNQAELWDIEKGKLVKNFEGYLNKKREDGLSFSYDNWRDKNILKFISKKRVIKLSNDQKNIAIGGIDSTVLIINMETGKVRNNLTAHSKTVLAFDFHPTNNDVIATGGTDGKIILWDLKTGKIIESIKASRELIFDIQFTKNGDKIAYACWDNTIRIIDLKTKKIKIIQTDKGSPYSIQYSPNDLYLLSGDLGDETHFWEVDAGVSFRKLIGHGSITSGIDVSKNGKYIATSNWDGKVRVWDLQTGIILGKMENHSGAVYAVCFDPLNRFVASGGEDNQIILWNPFESNPIQTLTGHNTAITSIKINADGSKLFSCSEDGVIKVWDLQTKKEIYTRIQINRNEWLITDTRGNFDGSEKALKLVNYVSGLNVISVSSVFDKFYTPGLMNQIQKGTNKSNTGENLQKLIENQPLISMNVYSTQKRSMDVYPDSVYLWKNNKINFDIILQDKGLKVDEVRIYNNGKLVISEPFEEELTFRGKTEKSRNFEVGLSPGINNITALVVNENRTESNTIKFSVNFSGNKEKVELFIFTIGINEYKNNQYNLNYAVNDAETFRTVLKKGADSLFHEVYEYSLTNEMANKSNILAKINEIKQKIGPEDVFVFYYAGHGIMSESPDGNEDFYIVTHDIVNLYGDVKGVQEKAISAQNLMQFSIEIPAEKQLFILDACHSGGALNTIAKRGSDREKTIAQLARSTGTFFITAAQDVEYANEVGSLNHGLFTYALLEVLRGVYPGNGDDKVTINEIKMYVEERVPELTKEYHGSPQYPTGYGFGQDFPIVLLK